LRRARPGGGCSSRSRSTPACGAASWSGSSGATWTCWSASCTSGAAIGNYDDPEEVAEGDEDDNRLTTKTEAGERLVPILDGAQEALEVLYAAAVDTGDNASVFATIERKRGRDGLMRPTGRPLSPRMVTRVFRRYADRAGLPGTIRLHDLRHTAITNAISQGEDILLVAAFAGHAKTSTTVDVYSHLLPKRAHEAARRMRSVSHGNCV
jgi:integrase